MRFHKLDLNLLVALDALLTERSITRAAEKVNLSQPALSSALGRLRAYFEDDLLVQVGRQMEPTPRGQTLQEAARDVLLRIETSLTAQPQFDCTKSDREFKLLVSDYTMATLIPRALALAARQGSTARLKLLPQVRTPARALENGAADVLLIPKAYCSPEHPTEIILTENHVCAVWRESRAARQGLDFEAYAAAGHVIMVPHDSDLPAYESWFVQRYGLTRRVEVTCYSFSAPLFLVVGTELVATVHERLARCLQRSLPIALLPVPMPMPPLEQGMQWHKYRTQDPGLAWLLQLLRDAAGRLDDELDAT